MHNKALNDKKKACCDTLDRLQSEFDMHDNARHFAADPTEHQRKLKLSFYDVLHTHQQQDIYIL